MSSNPETSAASGTLRRRSNTRARLLAAAVEVFVERGARRVTVDDIVGAAGFTRGAFYSNFNTIEEVLLEAFREESERMIASVTDAIRRQAGDADGPWWPLITALEALRPVEDRWYVLQSEVTLLSLRDNEARATVAERVAALDELLHEVIDDVLLRAGRRPNVPAALLTQTIMAMYLHSLTLRAIDPDRERGDALLTQVLPEVVNGLTDPLPA